MSDSKYDPLSRNNRQQQKMIRNEQLLGFKDREKDG